MEMAGRVFLRIGTWRPQEYSLNYAQGRQEAGVSVFEAIPEGERFRVVFDNDPDDRQRDTLSGLLARMKRDRDDWGKDIDPIYIVTGQQVGIGYDGEPLLKKVKIEREIDLGQVFAPDIGWK